ncbi:hypothetical protein ACVWYG_000656 [Pedobacter sp. UYEF25]
MFELFIRGKTISKMKFVLAVSINPTAKLAVGSM